MSKLATIQKIKSLEPIEGADKIELAKMEDVFWQVVVKKGEFYVGDKIIYIQIDTILPDADWSDFLKRDNKPIRLKTIKLRGVLSQGLIIPFNYNIFKGIRDETVISDLNKKLEGETSGKFEDFWLEGSDVTEFLRIQKYEKPIKLVQGGSPEGSFPKFLRVTDEERIQNYPRLIQEITGKACYFTLKMDGTSATFYKLNGKFGVCSRKLEWKDEGNNIYWKIAKKYDLINKVPEGFAIQGEICGPNIQKNKAGLSEYELYVFNVWDIQNQRYIDYPDFQEFCFKFNLKKVPCFYETGNFDYSIEELLKEASELTYPSNNSLAEGMVIRPKIEAYSKTLNGRLSFKVISNAFALKYGE